MNPALLSQWQFWIDVGGTFTDCIGLSPAGEIHLRKILSTGVIKARVGQTFATDSFDSPGLSGFGGGFFTGYMIRFLGDQGQTSGEARVAQYDTGSGSFRIVSDAGGIDDASAPGQRFCPSAPMAFELSSGEPAPILGIRLILGLGLDKDLGDVDVRLGTTRATNALLERRGAPTALITTEGFGDILRIGDQARPRLFDLNIRKPEVLFTAVAEIPERIVADGSVVRPLDEGALDRELERLRGLGVRSLAVCLMNSYRNPAHEHLISERAAIHGFDHVSISSRVSQTIRIVPRATTTVVDSYLSPVVRDYVARIGAAIRAGSLRLMTSAGGLVAADRAHGKDLILSGPAGGVVGFAGAARAAGFDRAIGFDMGGTSTDVSRFDGEFVYEYEADKAGVRIVAPMLAIETVASGGGSICDFDAQKLIVGPRSAGAEPGPACYGRGGPLAVTDVNLYLGRLVPRFFPFALDRSAVEGRLDELRARIEDSAGRSMTRVELAEGFGRIANSAMAAAIRKISVAQGYDLRQYALVCFGGAAGQHACALARELGVATILAHPYAGVLSAWGMGLADVRRFAEQSVLEPLDEARLVALELRFVEFENRLREEVRAEGISDSRIAEPIRRLDLRYVGQSSSITVARPERGTWAAAFEDLHRQLFGHAFTDRAIEIAAVRVEVVGRMARRESPDRAEIERMPEARERTPVVFGGLEIDTPLFERRELRAGDRIEGPAIVIEETGAIVIEPGWRAHMAGRGDLVLTDAGADSSWDASAGADQRATDSDAENEKADSPSAAPPDPILLEIFNNQFAAIAARMGVTLRRTALSVNVKERLDFSCALFTPQGDLVANAPHVPVHLGAMSECVRCIIRDVPDLAPGDVIATNDPMRGGSHLPDVTVVTPVFGEPHASSETGEMGSGGEPDEILFFTASRAHHAEIGGIRPGSMPPDSTNLAEEGVLIRNFKVVGRGMPRMPALRELLESGPWPSRAPEENLADISAQIAANQSGAQSLLALVREHSASVVHAYMRHIQDAAESKTRAALMRLKDGDYKFEDTLDSGAAIRVTITKLGASAQFDFTGTSPVVSDNHNANLAIVKAAVIYCLRLLIDEDIPLNDGVLAAVELVVPEGMLNPPSPEDPRDCCAVVGGNVETSQRIVDVILGALGLAAASQGTMNNLTFGDETFGYYETICGGAGAGPGFAGADAVHTHMTNTRLTDPEVLESRYPVRLRRFAIRRDSGGAGCFKGGDGVIREIEFLAPLDVSILSNRRTTQPFGLAGGGPGAAGINAVIRRAGEGNSQVEEDSQREDLGNRATLRMQAGDVLIIETPGGGGSGEGKRKKAKAKRE